MSEKDKLRSMVELMNDALRTVRDYYDSEYAYYVERDDEEITMVYEWCAENIPWQRDRIKMLSPDQFPKMVEGGSYRHHRRQLQCILFDGGKSEGNTGSCECSQRRVRSFFIAFATPVYFTDNSFTEITKTAGISKLP